MTTLEEAWDWYLATVTSLKHIERLADKHWESLPWDGPLGRDPDLVEEVNQVRRYRNWVAHGRRGDPPGNPPIRIDPRSAYDRLSRFLAIILPQPTPPM